MTTAPSLLPCVCGGEPESCRDIERNVKVCWVECRDCIASTPECRVYSTAFRIWNAMQQAALDAKEKSNVER